MIDQAVIISDLNFFAGFRCCLHILKKTSISRRLPYKRIIALSTIVVSVDKTGCSYTLPVYIFFLADYFKGIFDMLPNKAPFSIYLATVSALQRRGSQAIRTCRFDL